MLSCAGLLSTPRTKALQLRRARQIAAPVGEDSEVTNATELEISSAISGGLSSVSGKTFSDKIEGVVAGVVHLC